MNTRNAGIFQVSPCIYHDLLLQILLALIGAYFHPTNGDMGVFAKIALTLSADKQAQFLQMLEHVLSKDLDEEFVGILSQTLGKNVFKSFIKSLDLRFLTIKLQYKHCSKYSNLCV
jgi:hypothetical protein